MPAPPTITFTARIEGDLFAIPIGFDQRAVFGRARPPVVVAIGGHRYRSTIAIMNGATFVPLRRSHRLAAGIDRAGDYEVTLTLDTEPREVAVPDALAEALDRAGRREAWDKASYTQRREDAEAVAGAKRDDTRARRIAAIVERMSL